MMGDDMRFIPGFVVIFMTLLIVQSLVSRIRRYLRLRHIPGPLSAGWTRLWLLRQLVSGKSHLALFEVNKKYGPIVKVGPYHVVTSDPELWRHIHGVRTPYTRGDWWRNSLRFHPDNDSLATLPPAEHVIRRGKMAAGYTGRDLGYHGIEAAVDRTILSLVHMIENRYVARNKPFDFGRKAQYFTLDVIADLSYGEPFGFVSRDEDRFGYVATTEKMFDMFLSITIYPWVYDIMASRVFKFMLPSENDRTGFGRFMAIAKEKAAERFGLNKKTQGDMLGSFVAHGLTQKEIEAEILFKIAAGSDTTSTAIRAILLLIITTPRVHTVLLSEILAATSSLDDGDVISNEGAQKMPYLQAVIKEGLRWHPPLGAMLSKRVPETGDEWRGVSLPPGTEVGIVTWGVMHDETFWGKDAGEFRPERWLDADLPRLKDMEATLALTFSYGRWQCLGKDIAWMELNKVFVELLRRFDLSVVDPLNPWSSKCVGMFTAKDFWIKAQPRNMVESRK